MPVASRRPAPAASALANAYMFHSSSLGILTSILRGASSEYREHAARLVELDPGYDDGLGDFLLASFHLVAPWPVGDSDEARAGYQRALALCPDSVRNHSGVAVYGYREGELPRSREKFPRARSAVYCPRERLFCAWMKRESEAVLAKLAP